MQRWIIGIVAVVIVCGAVFVRTLAMAATSSSPATGGHAAASVQKATIDTGDLQVTVNGSGGVIANAQSALSFDQPGVVTDVLVQQGDSVKAGQVLADEDNTTAQATLQQAEFNLAAAQSALDKLLEPVDARDIANAEANIKSAEGNYSSAAASTSPQSIQTANLQAQQSASAASSAEAVRKLAGGQYGDQDPNYTKTLAQVGAAQFNAQIASLRAKQAQEGSSVLKATANITYYQAILAQVEAGPSQNQINAAQAQLATAKVLRDQAQHQLDNTKLLAPYDGVATTVNAVAGQVSNGPAVIITDTNTIYVSVNVDESNIGQVQIGQPVQIAFDALSGASYTGKVTRIAQTADATASVITYPVRVALDKPDSQIKVDMTANALFIIKHVQNVIRIPNQFLKQNRATNQITTTLVNPNGTFTDVPLKLGLRGADYSEVLEGLHAGEVVALIANTSAISQ